MAAQVNRAVIYADPPSTRTEVVELEVPKPGPGQVLVRIHFSGVCHTDLGICTNAFDSLPIPTPKGQVGGHEGIGDVTALGDGVEESLLNTRVGIKWAADACLSCDACLEGGETCCPSGSVSGYVTPGTFQQHVLAPARYVTRIPTTLDPASASPLMCGGVTVFSALKRARVEQGQWVVVIGAGGGLGHLAIQFGRALGVRILGLDIGSKREFCMEMGADAFVDVGSVGEEELVEEVKRVTGKGARVCMVCSSRQQSYDQAMRFLGFRGTLVCLGVPDKGTPIAGAKVFDMINSELSIFALKSGSRLEAKQCLEVAARHSIKTHYQLRKPEELSQVFEELEGGMIQGRVVLDLR